MGFLRFMLAVSVVLSHSHEEGGFAVLPAHIAVTSFFVISGFYMGLVLSTKYGSHYRIFLLSRALRIYPLYFLVLFIALSMFLGASLWKGHPVDRLGFYADAWQAGHWGVVAFLALIQITVVGIDLPCLLSYSTASGAHLLVDPFNANGILMERMLFLPQSWSIGFELLFYLMIPWLGKFKTRYLLPLLIASLALKLGTRIHMGDMTGGKWDYQFFPPQLCYFLSGYLAYRHRELFLRLIPRMTLWICAAWLTFLFFAWTFLPGGFAEFTWTGVMVIMIPSLFFATCDFRFDSWLGNLSYPIYLIHIPVRWLMLGPGSSYGDAVSTPLFLLFSILAAIALAETFEKWLERFRGNYIKKKLKDLG